MNTIVYYLNIALILSSSFAAGAQAQEQSARDWASLVGQRFRAERDIVYKIVDGVALKLDLYVPYDNTPGPTALYIHGGGWQTGSKEQYALWYLPYLQLGMRVVAVQYRLSDVAPAPAAIEDCRCAFRWVAAHGAKYGIDVNRIVVTGGSAGGHLALMTVMGDASFDRDCQEDATPRARAVINYYGATDIEARLSEERPHVNKWLRGAADRQALARRVSPINYVRAGLPPVLTLHGDADEMVSYEQGVRLHRALTDKGVPNELITIRGGRHGRHTWTDADTIRAQRAIEAFLKRHKILTLAPPPSGGRVRR